MGFLQRIQNHVQRTHGRLRIPGIQLPHGNIMGPIVGRALDNDDVQRLPGQLLHPLHHRGAALGSRRKGRAADGMVIIGKVPGIRHLIGPCILPALQAVSGAIAVPQNQQALPFYTLFPISAVHCFCRQPQPADQDHHHQKQRRNGSLFHGYLRNIVLRYDYTLFFDPLQEVHQKYTSPGRNPAGAEGFCN